MKNNRYLLQFNPKLPRLSRSEKAVLKLLVEAGKLIVPIFTEQEKKLQENGNFYPKGVSSQEIKEAVRKNPEILSPFTVVEKINGEIVAIPYHVKYAALLKPIAEKLNRASTMIDNQEFSRFLKLQAMALLEGNYEEAIAAWLKMKPYILDIYIGPLEHYDDEVFFAKAAYQAWVGVMEEPGTKRLINYKNVILSARREALIPGERLSNYEKVKVTVDDVLLVSGFMAKAKFVGRNIPMNLEQVEKYGSAITLFNQVNDLRMEQQILPVFKTIFSPEFRQGYSREDLRRGSLRYVAFHELAHNYLYYKNSVKNLGNLLPSIYELAATLLGMRIAGSLLLKEMINSQQIESMIIAFICRSYDLIEKSKHNKSMANYALGGTIFINFMLESGALKQKGGMAMPNFMKIFVSLHELAYLLERLISSGTRKDAEVLIQKYGQENKIL